ncbi:DUF1801 domain-containing protein [Flaviramulus sp. BrNp1-15]|uniref:DUF1801 domain-containing protein n=1 Tax=Flaviramulus sp. BrNp1-15 TaxID=2916754 RepID=UPI001EE7E959|nr:DUF1801 domain-containing protein [Flaviramulus sp. BrNp1-15]ULC58379.1 DUF1801 domain-containing protein [Flaviramulus sp. BrNp1-15]
MKEEVKKYLSAQKKWNLELTKLREIVLDCGLTEDFKWRNPCYTDNDKNIVLIGAFKDYCLISFLKGALLKDPDKILENIGKNTKSAKLIAFKSLNDIDKLENTLKVYIKEAIDVERKGLKIDTKNDELEYPLELLKKFNENPEFKLAFTNLTKGRQRGYLLHFSGAKQSKTRTSRIEKYEKRIFNGKGIMDCVCGLSKRMPNCDGSHKQLENIV